ncbi:zf-PARP-domain-containing protein [Stipitochalara longipes BDJ]|nr:zf-PARP-domain-containing protein [Stipitochalara longipes BDJ]
MSYRVETAKTGRSGCSVKACKEAGIKIDKGELRFGSWVEGPDFSSWSWRHWGCVTGKQLQNLRVALADPDQPDGYNWEMLDGYEGDEPSSLVHHPDLQKKVRRVIMQGYIDPEDFNGDPEMNQLGKKGLYLTDAQKRKMEEVAIKAAADAEDAENTKPAKAKAKAKAKRGRAKVESDSEEVIPAKKKRAIKVKKEVVDDDKEEAKPANKPRAKKAKKEEDAEMYEGGVDIAKPAPVKKPRAKKVKPEDAQMDENEEDAKHVPTKKARGKKGVKQEDQNIGEAEEENTKPAPARKVKGKKAVKQEEEQVGEANEADRKPASTKKSRGKKTVKQEREEVGEVLEEDAKPTPLSKKARGKKAVNQEAAEDGDGIGEVGKRKPATKRGRKVVKEEPSKDTSMTAPEASSTSVAVAEAATADIDLPEFKPAAAVKSELSEDTNMTNVPSAKQQLQEAVIESAAAVKPALETFMGPVSESAAELATEADSQAINTGDSESQKKKGSRGKKGAARMARSRTASKA